MSKSNRREFLKRSLTAGATTAASAGGIWFFVRRGKQAVEGDSLVKPEYRRKELPTAMYIARERGPVKNLREALEAVGGIEKYIGNGERVLIKPNVGWDKSPKTAANTNPFVIGELVRQCIKAGAREVIVTDNTCNEAKRCFLRSGIGKAAEDAGARVFMPKKKDFVTADLGGEFVGRWQTLRVLFQVDRVINVPVLKHHSSSGLTMAMKNWYGIIGGVRGRLHQRMDRAIVDLASFVRPTLTVLDAHRVMTRNGPTGGSVRDVEERNVISVSTDEVAIDAFGAELMGISRKRIRYIDLAAGRGLGMVGYHSLLKG